MRRRAPDGAGAEPVARLDGEPPRPAAAGADGRGPSTPGALRLIARHALFAGVPLGELAPLVENCELRP